MGITPISVTVSEACKISGLGKTKIYELCNSGALKSSIIAGRRLIRFDSLDQFLSCN